MPFVTHSTTFLQGENPEEKVKGTEFYFLEKALSHNSFSKHAFIFFTLLLNSG